MSWSRSDYHDDTDSMIIKLGEQLDEIQERIAQNQKQQIVLVIAGRMIDEYESGLTQRKNGFPTELLCDLAAMPLEFWAEYPYADIPFVLHEWILYKYGKGKEPDWLYKVGW